MKVDKFKAVARSSLVWFIFIIADISLFIYIDYHPGEVVFGIFSSIALMFWSAITSDHIDYNFNKYFEFLYSRNKFLMFTSLLMMFPMILLYSIKILLTKMWISIMTWFNIND